MMSVLQEVEGLTKKTGGKTVSTRNVRFTVYMVYLFDIGMACIIFRTDNHWFFKVLKKNIMPMH